MTDYDNRGQVALWKNESDNPKAPVLRGTVIAHRDIREGEEVEVSLWRNESTNPKAPRLKGKIQDRQERRETVPARTPGGADEYFGEDPDDSIPF